MVTPWIHQCIAMIGLVDVKLVMAAALTPHHHSKQQKILECFYLLNNVDYVYQSENNEDSYVSESIKNKVTPTI